MNYRQLQRRVERAERLVEGRGVQAQQHWADFKAHWREGWTPARIIAAGLVSGFVSGRAEPMRALTGPRLLQMIGAVSGLFASAQAAFAAEQAQDAADSAEEVAEQAGDTFYPDEADEADAAQPGNGYVPPTARTTATPDPVYQSQPRPAEAATEISER